MRQGRDILDRELARLNVKDVPTEAIAKQLKHKDTDALCVALGAGDLTSAAHCDGIAAYPRHEISEKHSPTQNPKEIGGQA